MLLPRAVARKHPKKILIQAHPSVTSPRDPQQPWSLPSFDVAGRSPSKDSSVLAGGVPVAGPGEDIDGYPNVDVAVNEANKSHEDEEPPSPYFREASHPREDPMILQDSGLPRRLIESVSSRPAPHPARGCVLYLSGMSPRASRQDTTNALEERLQVYNAETNDEVETSVEYVDHERGLCSGHVRLSTPQATETLLKLIQAGKLDPLSAERLTGRREEIYLEKVPRNARSRARRG